MSFRDKLQEIDLLEQTIREYGKLSDEVLRKINYKFRLDWNYYSNRMEGNTLTLEETKSVMVNNLTVENKPLKDVLEMSGHDEAIKTILRMGKMELNISESRIRELHKAIMYEDDPVKKEEIGKWKKVRNHIINYRDEQFYFTEPSDVPGEMHLLINWVNKEKEKITLGRRDALHPVQLAFDFHLKYLTIHPFYDGNGRTGRILMNIILISYGFPPIYIKDTEKVSYYRCLGDVQAYGADPDILFGIMADYLIRSLGIVLNAIEGKEIEELSDLDKKLQLLEMEVDTISPDKAIKTNYSSEAFMAAYNSWIEKLLIVTIPLIQKFNKFFIVNNHNIHLAHPRINVDFVDEPIYTIIKGLEEKIQKDIEGVGQVASQLSINTYYRSFVKGGLQTFDCNYSIEVKFEDTRYEVVVDDFDETTHARKSIRLYKRLLHQPLTDEEMQDTAQKLGNAIYKHINYYVEENKLKE